MKASNRTRAPAACTASCQQGTCLLTDSLKGDDRRNRSNPCNPSMTLDSDDDEPDSDNIDDVQLGLRAANGKQQSFVNDIRNGKMCMSCLKVIHENRVFKNKSGNNLINSAYIGNYLQVP